MISAFISIIIIQNIKGLSIQRTRCYSRFELRCNIVRIRQERRYKVSNPAARKMCSLCNVSRNHISFVLTVRL